MYIFGEVRKRSHDQLSRVRRRFRVVVSGPYWAPVRSMEYNLYSLGSPAVGFCLELGSGSRGGERATAPASSLFSGHSPSLVVSLETSRIVVSKNRFFYRKINFFIVKSIPGSPEKPGEAVRTWGNQKNTTFFDQKPDIPI